MITPIPWREMEDGIQEFLVAASEYPEDQVIWADQTAPRPPYPYISINVISGPNKIGTLDEQKFEAPTTMKTRGVREMTISCNVYGTPNSVDPETSARSIIGVIEARLGVDSFRSILQAVGLAVREINSVTLPSQNISNSWISRGNLDIRLGLASNIEEQVSTIETVHIEAVGPGVGDLPDSIKINGNFGG